MQDNKKTKMFDSKVVTECVVVLSIYNLSGGCPNKCSGKEHLRFEYSIDFSNGVIIFKCLNCGEVFFSKESALDQVKEKIVNLDI